MDPIPRHIKCAGVTVIIRFLLPNNYVRFAIRWSVVVTPSYRPESTRMASPAVVLRLGD